MFRFMLDETSIGNARNFVSELNQSIWADYLTGLSVGLSLKKRHLIVDTALDGSMIQKDVTDVSEIILFIINAAKKHHAHEIINFSDFSDREQAELSVELLRCDLLLTFVVGDDVEKEFDEFKIFLQ